MTENQTLQDKINLIVDEKLKIEKFKPSNQIELKANAYGITCKRCHRDDCIHVQEIQTRSADEAKTKVYMCLNCGNTWNV